MKVAVTVWEDRISPVFDASRRLLIAEIENAQITDRSYVLFDSGLPSNLAKTLAKLDVPVLICGAVSQIPATIISTGGIRLIPFIAGEVERVLEVYAKGHSLEPTFVMPGCHGCISTTGKPVHKVLKKIEPSKKEQPLTQHLFVTPDKANLADLAAGIEKQGGTIHWAASGDQALKTIGKQTVDLVVTDEHLGDMTGLEFVKRLVAVNPMINSAAVSSLSNKAYHEASEGLGILIQLPPRPDQADGERLMAHLNQILGLTAADR